jgi:peptidoglycan LD-endopeptidase LytH
MTSPPSLAELLGQPTFAEVIALAGKSICSMDFSEKNTALRSQNLQDTAAFEAYVNAHLQAQQAIAGVGGYLENRVIYRQRPHFEQTEEARSIHLGIDIWMPAGTEVQAPLDGRIHSWAFNDHFGDYGPTIILEHNLAETTFYTLYGHLSLTSLEGLQKGALFRAGQRLGWLGPYPENGDWPPHLHFQVMADMLGHEGDFPGVCRPSDQAYFAHLCPNPQLILRLPL